MYIKQKQHELECNLTGMSIIVEAVLSDVTRDSKVKGRDVTRGMLRPLA